MERSGTLCVWRGARWQTSVVYNWAPAPFAPYAGQMKKMARNGDVYVSVCAVCACPFGSFWISCLLFHLSAHYASYISAPASRHIRFSSAMCVAVATTKFVLCSPNKLKWKKICCRRRFRQRIVSNWCTWSMLVPGRWTSAIANHGHQASTFRVLYCFSFHARACIDCCVPLFLSTRRAPHGSYMLRSIYDMWCEW